MERDSMVLYRSFIESIVKLEKQFDSEKAMQLFKAIAYYGVDGKINDDVDPIIDLMFTSIKPQIDANTKRFENGKKGGRPKKTNGNKDKKPVVSDNKTNGYETKKPMVSKSKTNGYESKNHRLLNEKPNVNVNGNVNDNENDNVYNGKEKKLNFSKDNIRAKHKQITETFQIDAPNKLRKDKYLYEVFCKWLIYNDVNDMQRVEMHLKQFIRMCKKLFTTESIIEATEHAMLNNHKTIHPNDKIPQEKIYIWPDQK